MLNKKACREFAAPGVAMSPDNELLHAEQNKYIVQTAVRIIGHRKTLVLYFHDRKQAAQGDFRPVWTMFHSKDGYITLERKEDGKTTWRTASFDNLDKHWPFVKNCAFYTPEDRERLERYFHSGGCGFAPLIQAQEAMKAKRLEQRLEKRRQKVWDRMACVPALPRGWKSWACRTAVPAYFFYDYQRSKAPVKGVCTGCGHEVTLAGVKHNGHGTCPHCGREVIMKSRGRRGWIEDRHTCQIIQKTAPDEIVIRIIKVGCYYKNDTPVKDAHENARLFIRFDDNGPVHWEEFYYSYTVKRWKSGERPVYSLWTYNYEADIAGHVYCQNLTEVFENTPWKYCPLAAFYGRFRKPMAVIPFLAAYLKQPRLEHLVKVGFCALARDLAYDEFSREIPLDQTQDRTHRILQVQAGDVDFLRSLDVDFDTLKIYQEYCWENLKDRQKLLFWQLAHGVKRDVLETLEYMTVHKMLRYLDAQYSILKDRRPPAHTPRYRSMQAVLSEYRDYLDMCAGQDYDMHSSFVLYPKDLQASHDRVAQHIEAKNDTEILRDFAAAYARIGNSLDFEYKGMKIIRPDTPNDVVQEGNALRHCVGGYVSRIAKRECLILFLRRSEDVVKPFYTIELRHRRIVQVRGQGNQDPTHAVQDFINHWRREVLQAVVYEAA